MHPKTEITFKNMNGGKKKKNMEILCEWMSVHVATATSPKDSENCPTLKYDSHLFLYIYILSKKSGISTKILKAFI